MNNTQYKEYYNHQYKEKDQHYYTAIIATSRKFLRYYFAMLKASREDNGTSVMKEVTV